MGAFFAHRKQTGPAGFPAGPAVSCGELPFDVVVHIHQIADAAHIVGDVGIAVDGVLDGAAGHGKVDHIHGLVVVQHGVDEAAGEGITTAHAVQNVKGVQLALEGVTLVCPLPIQLAL